MPEVSNYTDAVSIGDLGLPVGFELDRVELNVAALVRTARWGNIGHIIIAGFRGETSAISSGMSSVNGGGSAVASPSISISKASLHDSSVDTDHTSTPGYRWKRAGLQINNAEIEERIKQDGDKWDKGVFDPAARAHYMNKALRRSLWDASKNSVHSDSDLGWATTCYTVWSAFDVAWGDPLPIIVVKNLIVGSILNGIKHGAHVCRDDDERNLPRQWSALQGVYYDRLAVAGVQTAATRFVRAK